MLLNKLYYIVLTALFSIGFMYNSFFLDKGIQDFSWWKNILIFLENIAA